MCLTNALDGFALGGLDAVAALDGANVALVGIATGGNGDDGSSESSEGEELGVHV